MSTPGDLAADLARANDEMVAFARSCTPEGWTTIVPGEEWPVCAVVHHVAEGYDLVSRWIDCALAGTPIEDTEEGIDAANLRHAATFAGVGLEETVELLGMKSGPVVAKIGQLAESDLPRSTAFGPAGGRPFSVEQFCMAAAGHVRSHLGRARAALGSETPS